MPGSQHGRLQVYERALTIVERMEAIARRIPEHRLDLRDQLRRASTSVALNIAEGAGEFSPSEKSKFYRYARRSAAECSAILDVVERSIGIRESFPENRDDLARIGGVLTKLIQSAESRKR